MESATAGRTTANHGISAGRFPGGVERETADETCHRQKEDRRPEVAGLGSRDVLTSSSRGHPGGRSGKERAGRHASRAAVILAQE
jgi:hypothetical protein